jgi:ubiquinol-cytochrome c reductase iron-sulfur subunit
LSETTADVHGAAGHDEPTRRDFIFIATGAVAAGGVAAVAWPLIDQMNPAADTLALSTVDFDLAAVEEGQQVKVMWRGKPLFVRHRTAADIATAQKDDSAPMKDPQADADRVKQVDGKPGKAQYLIMGANCTHLGCVPLGVHDAGFRGHFGGWFCPCHGSDYDTSGRIRNGPAPQNLPVPDYKYLSDTLVKIGAKA